MDWKLEVVAIPVTDVDRAKRFYSEQLGFVVDNDARLTNDMRFVQLTPPGSACSIHLSSGIIQTRPGSVEGMQLVVPDIGAARAELVERGVGVSEFKYFEDGDWVTGRGEGWNSYVFFSDPDGNGWVVQESPPPS
jgi:catechol 2,3-dioxygenase-like lactoylglutathione lyase family enzyme